jgi:arsenite methyltransferase
MLALAAKRPTDAGTAPIELRHGEATHIPYDADAFDAAVSTQVLEYVPDIPEALAELRRVLRPGGRLLVLDTDWDSIVWRSNDDERMRRVLGTWDQHLADPHLPRTLVSSLRHAGFDVARPVIVPLLNVGFDPNCFSANLVSVIARYVAGRDGWSDEAVQAWAADLRQLGVDYFFSLNGYVFQATNLA